MFLNETGYKKNKLYSIGEVSKNCGLSVKTLRHYDEINLLKPAYVDQINKRRFYNEVQLYHILLIKKLKELKFSLEEIKNISFNQELDPKIQLFSNRLKANESEIEQLKKSNKDIKNWLNLFHWLSQNKVSEQNQQKVVLKTYEERKIAFYRSVISFKKDKILFLGKELGSLIEKHTIEEKDWYLFVIYSPIEKLNPDCIDLEIGRIVADKTDEKLPFIRKIPQGHYLSIIHQGSLLKAFSKFQLLKDFAKMNQYELIGSLLAFYIVPLSWVESEDKMIIEFQIQVKKSR